MRALQLIRERVGKRIRLVEFGPGFGRQRAERGRMQIWTVIALREAVDKYLPVALKFGLEPIDLVRARERIAFQTMRKFTKERAQRLRVPGVEIDEDETLPHLAQIGRASCRERVCQYV